MKKNENSFKNQATEKLVKLVGDVTEELADRGVDLFEFFVKKLKSLKSKAKHVKEIAKTVKGK